MRANPCFVLIVLITSNVVFGAIEIGSRLEPFVDEYLIDSKQNLELRLTEPIKREVVLELNKPWEGATAAYYTVFRDGDKVRLYYRGASVDDGSDGMTCYAQSTDGIHFTRPELGLVEFKGSKSNNIIFQGPQSASFAPFRDRNPNAKSEERYKALCYEVRNRTGTMTAMTSPDAIHWKVMENKSVVPPGEFDSLNCVSWDEIDKKYRVFDRYWTGGGFKGVRAIESRTSDDFVNWTKPVHNLYHGAEPTEHFYTSATQRYPGAEHLWIAFPMRFVPERTKVPTHKEPGISDSVFMSSRNGVNWDRPFMQSWVRPGPDENNWTDRNTMPAWGIVQSDAEPNVFSMYVSEHYRHPTNRLRRVTVRKDGFASMRASPKCGEFITKPLTFTGDALTINYATSAVGSIAVEIQDDAGQPLAGFAAADCETIFGDELKHIVKWKGGALPAKPVRLRFVMSDADLYAIQFVAKP